MLKAIPENDEGNSTIANSLQKLQRQCSPGRIKFVILRKMNMSEVPGVVRPIIEDYISMTSRRICAFYLVGSIALGEFNEQFSDIDFVAVLDHGATPTEVKELGDIHRTIERKHSRWKLSGSYIRPEDLGKVGNELGPHLHYHDGVLHPNSHSGLNSITWWELKHHGITLIGTESQTLPFTVDWDALISKMKENMNSYWVQWANRPGRILMLYSNWGIQWAVLGVLRQLYSFRENAITTKVRAGQYALGCLPARWHKLIQEAINIRQGKRKSTYRLRASRMIEAVRFLKYIIPFCNSEYPPR